MSADAAAAGASALGALEAALRRRPERDGDAFTAATDHLCRMRDALLAARDRGEDGGAHLPRLNAVISLVLAGHFPLGPTPWPEVEQARDALRALTEDVRRNGPARAAAPG